MSTKFMGGWKPQPNLPSNQFDKGGLTYNPGQQSPWMENMKADQALSEVMQNPFADQKAIKLGQDVGVAANEALASGSPFADLLADTQNALASIAANNDGKGLNPLEVTNLLGRMNNAFRSGGLSSDQQGLLNQAGGMLSNWLQENPMGEYDAYSGDNPTQGSYMAGPGQQFSPFANFAFGGFPGGFPGGGFGGFPGGGFGGGFGGFPGGFGGVGSPGSGGYGQF